MSENQKCALIYAGNFKMTQHQMIHCPENKLFNQYFWSLDFQ